MKKIIAILLAALMVLSFAACALNKQNTTEEAQQDTSGTSAKAETDYSDLAKSISLTKEEYGIGCRKDSNLTDQLNVYIDELMKDGTLKKLSEKYNIALADVAQDSASADKIAEDGDLAYIKNKGTLIVGITDYEPMDFKDANGKWTGFDAEFAEAVAKKMGVKVEFIEIDWDNKFLELQTKAIDCVWNGMTITDEVKLNTNCTKAYAKNEQVVVVKADKAASIKSVDDLKDLSFAVETGSAGESAAKDNGLKATPVQTQTNALLEVKAGSADACIIDSTMADSMLSK